MKKIMTLLLCLTAIFSFGVSNELFAAENYNDESDLIVDSEKQIENNIDVKENEMIEDDKVLLNFNADCIELKNTYNDEIALSKDYNSAYNDYKDYDVLYQQYTGINSLKYLAFNVQVNGKK